MSTTTTTFPITRDAAERTRDARVLDAVVPAMALLLAALRADAAAEGGARP